jgi:hypothetical protein
MRLLLMTRLLSGLFSLLGAASFVAAIAAFAFTLSWIAAFAWSGAFLALGLAAFWLAARVRGAT